MNSLYTSISAKIPENLTQPSASYKKHLWISVLGLVLFIGLYLLLTIWFGRLAVNLFIDANNFDGHFFNYLLAFGFAFLSVFMLKSLFFLNKRNADDSRRYITEKEEPVLFDYLYKLADEAGAPRPHKVFLTDRVNASVSYDLSLLNLIFPSKKNLEIGLGLVNVLDIGEFKAVLAHEFGHFAQRSMLLGRYVYVAQQVAARIVGKRDALDSFLAGISRIDIRIAWIGWILSILVWSIRSLIETCFSIVVVAERALSRQMEFHADLVAVSLTGSDALIHALYKLQVADEAYRNTLDCINEQLADKKAIKDMFVLQTNYIKKMSEVLDDPNYGKSPVVPEQSPESHRVFTSKKYNPPAMWSTHPADVDRENNAKRIYIPEPIDGRSSWDLFSDPIKYREELTANLIKTANVDTTIADNDTAVKAQDKEYFNWTFLKSEYHSAFYKRYPFLTFKTYEEFYDAEVNDSNLKEVLQSLYPKDLAEKVSLFHEIQEEIEALEAVKNEALTVEKRLIWHRGNQIKRNDIPDILKSLEGELEALRTDLAEHDKRCRTSHFKAAEHLNKDLGMYLKKLSALVHYAEHNIVNVNDAGRKFGNVLSVALADGKVSSSEMMDIMNSGHDYHNSIRSVFKQSETIVLDDTLLKNMNLETYNAAFQKFELPVPTNENINDWIGVVDGWAAVAVKALRKLRNEALELLLDKENEVKDAYLNNKTVAYNWTSIMEPKSYKTLTPGSERKIQRKLGFWDRFFVGDGLVPSAMKFGVSGSILLTALFFGSYNQKLPLHIYNGLQTNVKVFIDGKTIDLYPNDSESLDVSHGKTYAVKTTTGDDLPIEELEVVLDEHSAYVYNVANAATFVKYSVYYGYDGSDDTKMLGAEQWFPVSADYILEEPPSSITTSSTSRGDRREVVRGYSDVGPDNLLSIVENEQEQNQMIASHVKWDDNTSKDIVTWMYYLTGMEGGYEVLESRLERNPTEFMSLRAIQDIADSTQHVSICEQHTKFALENPDNADYYYLSVRCLEDEDEKDKKFIEGHKKWKDHNWLAYASAHVYRDQGDLTKSYEAFKVAADGNESMREIVAIDAERIKRILNDIHGEDRYPTIIFNDDLNYYNSLESGDIEGLRQNVNYAYYLMAQGKLDEAYEVASIDANAKPYILRLLAASDGADKELLDEAFALDALEGINLNSVWATIGLMEKHNKNYEEYLPMFAALELDGGFSSLISNIKARQFNAVDNQIGQVRTEWQAQVYLMASIILDNNIPEKWKRYISVGLFNNEKPYIK